MRLDGWEVSDSLWGWLGIDKFVGTVALTLTLTLIIMIDIDKNLVAELLGNSVICSYEYLERSGQNHIHGSLIIFVLSLMLFLSYF